MCDNRMAIIVIIFTMSTILVYLLLDKRVDFSIINHKINGGEGGIRTLDTRQRIHP